MENEELYQEAIVTYGAEKQQIVAVEELSELQKEICKALRGNDNIDSLTEEIADVEIMIDQIKLMYHITEMDVERWKRYKLSRLSMRLREGLK